MLDGVIQNWLTSFTAEEQKELLALQKEVKTNRIFMNGYPTGQYSGVRWFFNNDDLMKRLPIIISILIWLRIEQTVLRVPHLPTTIILSYRRSHIVPAFGR